MNTPKPTLRWPRRWLIAAGIYNIAWGAMVVAFPLLLFDATGMEPPRYPQIWQCVGMIVGVFGIGYLAAARDYRRHWPIILVGLLGKTLGPLGFAVSLMQGDFLPAFGITIITNDLIWLAPFTMMLWSAAKSHSEPRPERVALSDALQSIRDQDGRTLQSITEERPTLVVLLRHSGCTFCKEALADLSTQRSTIETAGAGIAVISMSTPEDLQQLAQQYDLPGTSWISDPDRLAYRALELGRGSVLQLFGPAVWWRGLVAALGGHGVGRLDGDGFQMPGSFIIHRGAIVRAHRHRHAAERVDHATFACELPA